MAWTSSLFLRTPFERLNIYFFVCVETMSPGYSEVVALMSGDGLIYEVDIYLITSLIVLVFMNWLIYCFMNHDVVQVKFRSCVHIHVFMVLFKHSD